MSFVTIVKPIFANVPKLPGVPAIPRSLASLVIGNVNTPVLLGQISNVLGLANLLNPLPVWGIFDSEKKRVLEPDSVVDLTQRADSKVSNFPVQAGAFATYNKVANANEAVVRFTKGGSQDARAKFLKDSETLIKSLSLFSVVTPEMTYTNMNAQRFELSRRSSAGAYFIDLEMFFVEVRQVQPQYSTTTGQPLDVPNPPITSSQNPAAVSSTSKGLQQPLPGSVGHRPDGVIVRKIPGWTP